MIDGVRVVRVRNMSGIIRTWLDTSTPRALTRRARELFAVAAPPDIVHLHELWTVENWRVIGSVPSGTPVITSTHGVWRARHSGWTTRVEERLLRPLLRRLDHVVVQSGDEVVRVREMWERQHLCLEDEEVSVVPATTDVAAIERALRQVYAFVRARAHVTRRSC